MAVTRDRTPIGTLMVRKGLLTEVQLREALDRQREAGGKLGETCVRLGFLTEDQMLDVVEGQIGVPRVRLGGYLVEPEALGLVPASVARRHLVVPLFRIENTLTVAMVDPLNVYAIDELHQITSLDVDPALSSRGEIDEAIRQYYGSGGTIRDVISEASRAHAASGRAEDLSPEAMAQDAPVIRLVNLLLSQAVAESASDVHVEPCAADVRVRFRVDGVLHEQSSLPQHMAAAVASRIKIMANLDIAERRIPQDGRLQLSVAGRSVDMRVSTYPTIFGEKVVVRVLDKERMAIGLEQVGLEPDTLSSFEEVIVRPTGIVLITGPTGSGKTTTLYGVLRRIATIEKNVMTIEDPIEYFLDVVNQSQMNLRAGLTFATGLRSILRQDPDVIMVGEIRDLETAEVAIRAAMTGHLVLSTLHTNDAAGALARLVDMGVEPFLVASSVVAVLAQRLARKVCRECAAPYTPPEEALARIGPAAAQLSREALRRGKGCAVCKHTGYQGRTGLFELLRMDSTIEDLMTQKATASLIRDRAVAAGMRTLRSDGLLKAARGATTVEEVLKVT